MVCSLRVKYWAPKRASSGDLNWAPHKLSKFSVLEQIPHYRDVPVLRPRQVLGYNFSTGKTLTMNDLWRYWRFLLIFHIYKSTITIETSCWSLKTFLSFFSRMQAERLTTAFWNAQLVPPYFKPKMVSDSVLLWIEPSLYRKSYRVFPVYELCI